jgi:predicted transcriptional regulator
MIKNRSSQLKVISGVLILFLVQACTSLSTMFYWADTYLAWQIDDYFDLTNEQEDQINRRLDYLLANLKQQEVPKYKDFLREVKLRVQKQLTEDDLGWFRNRLSKFNLDIAMLLANDASLFLHGLNSGQLTNLEERLVESNKEWLDERQDTLQKSNQDKLDRMVDRIENWIGSISDSQKQEIVAMNLLDSGNNDIRYAHRLQSQQKFLRILKTSQSKEEIQTRLLAWVSLSPGDYGAEYEEYMNNRNKKSTKLILMLKQTASDKQKQFFLKKVDGYLKELDKIASD